MLGKAVVVNWLGEKSYEGVDVLYDDEEIISTLDRMSWLDINVEFIECLIERLGKRLGFEVVIVKK